MFSEVYKVLVLLSVVAGPSQGQLLKEDTTIWTAHENHIYYTADTVNWTDSQNKQYTPLIAQIRIGGGAVHNSFGLAYDHHTDRLVTSHPDVNMLALVFLKTNISVFLYVGTSKDVGQLTIDWTAKNLYWADGGFRWIAMKRLPATSTFDSREQDVKLVVDKHLQKPTGITVYPDKYYLFWADAGSSPKIERSNLVGEGRRVLVFHNLMSPTCLTLDSRTDRLFWSDQARATLEYSDLDGHGRDVLASNPDYGYYGIAVFQDSLLFTAPGQNVTGFYSLRDNILGRYGHAMQFYVSLYYVDVFDKDEQPREEIEGCESAVVGNCDQLCIHAETDRGATCYCYDGYSLHPGDGATCTGDSHVLERHLLFSSGGAVCSVSVTAITSPTPLPVDCSLVNHTTHIRTFALDMAERKLFFAAGASIYNTLLDDGSEPEEMVTASGEITDMDYDWKSRELFWIISGGSHVYYVNTSHGQPDTMMNDMTSQVTNIAVDPHSRSVYWLAGGSRPVLRVWQRDDDLPRRTISTLHMRRPTDLQYDRLTNSLAWNDASGFLGVINVDGTNEHKYETATTGEDRHALTVFKRFLVSSTAESLRHLDVVYRGDATVSHVTLQLPPDHTHILDMHVFDTTLQPQQLDPCEVNNGGCEHICVYGTDNEANQCSCYLGYRLQSDQVSCRTSLLSSGFFLVLDALNAAMYQMSTSGGADDDIRAVATDGDNQPSALAYDMKRSVLVWLDQTSRLVKMKHIDDTTEHVMGSNVDEKSQVSVDVTNGNFYVTSGSKILVIDEYETVKTIRQAPDIKGTLGNIQLFAEKGLLAWVETGASTRLVLANMDGSNVKVIHDNNDHIAHPEDVAFDHETGAALYWCDSGLGKIEEVQLGSLASRTIYQAPDFRPLALDVADSAIFFLLEHQRKIYRINRDGSGIAVVIESPLFGQLTHLYVSKPIPKDHALCKVCNGGCSTLCLPRGEDQATCACRDGQTLLPDGKTCNTAKRCSAPSAAGLSGLSGCCIESPRAICTPVCEEDHTPRYSYAVKCSNGNWNVSLDSICEGADEPGFPMALVAGAAGGGAALLVLVVAIVLVCRRKHKRKFERRRPSLPSALDVNGVAGGARTRPYDLGDGTAQTQLPQRPLTAAEQADGGEYQTLDDALIAKTVHLPPEDHKKGTAPGRDRYGSERYSRFPGATAADPYYLTPTTEFTPQPDYPTYGLDVDEARVSRDGPDPTPGVWPGVPLGEDGYLAASSVGAPSQKGSDFSETWPYGGSETDAYRDSRGARLDFLQSSMPTDTNGNSLDVPLAHLGSCRGSDSGAMLTSGFDGHRF